MQAYPAEVVRIIDGDTFEARVRVWPGLDVNTKVRLRNIDAPELHARCSDELEKRKLHGRRWRRCWRPAGLRFRGSGSTNMPAASMPLVATRNTADVSAALLNGGWARSYGGGRRGSWC